MKMKYGTIAGKGTVPRYLLTVCRYWFCLQGGGSKCDTSSRSPVAPPAAEPQHLLAMDLQGQVFQVLVNQGQEEELGKGFFW